MGSTPTFEEVLIAAIDWKLAEVHTCMPGEIVKYDATKQKADVRVCLKKKYADGEVVEYPVIPSVPVMHPRAGKRMIHLPMAVGDTVWVFFSERSIDKWLSKGGVVDPEDGRKFHLSDAVCIPGGYPFSNSTALGDPDAFAVMNGSTELRLQEDGEATLEATMVRLGEHTASHPAALGDATEARLAAIESGISTLVTYITTHVHATAAPGAPSPPTVPPVPFTPDMTAVEAEKVSII